MIEDFNLEDLIGKPEDIDANDNHSQEITECALYKERIAATISESNAKNLLERSITQDQCTYDVR